LPRAVGILIAANVGIYLLQVTMPPDWARWVIVHLGFIPARWSIPGGPDWSGLISPVTHQFLHGGFAHIFLNMIMLAAFGSGVERLLGGRRLLIIYLSSGIAGAATHYLVYPESALPVVGASGAISGLFGAILRLMAKNPRVSGGFLRILPVIAIWLGIAVLTGFVGMPGTGEAQVAWAAHVGGFLLTLLFLDLFTIGAWPRRVP
jgi:membrane associated rhomboid family serine protease